MNMLLFAAAVFALPTDPGQTMFFQTSSITSPSIAAVTGLNQQVTVDQQADQEKDRPKQRSNKSDSPRNQDQTQKNSAGKTTIQPRRPQDNRPQQNRNPQDNRNPRNQARQNQQQRNQQHPVEMDPRERLEHLVHAAELLDRIGKHQISRQLHHEAEQIERQLQGQRPSHDRQDHFLHQEQQIHQLHQRIDQVSRQVENLSAILKKLTDEVRRRR